MTDRQQLRAELPLSTINKKALEKCSLLDLGTKKHWDACYERGLVNFSENQDIGEVWYGKDAATRVVNYIEQEYKKDSSIIDLGCGNGALLIDLAEEGFSNLYGVDYSQEAIDLANQIVKEKEYDIEYACADLCRVSNEGLLTNKYNICHDKGTYDAISMCPENPTEKKNAYIKTVYQLLDINGSLIITFCNWTEEELLQQFEEYFEKVHTIPTPSFMFGGNVGSFVTTVVFKKRLYHDICPPNLRPESLFISR